jgi:hypothetical protein
MGSSALGGGVRHAPGGMKGKALRVRCRVGREVFTLRVEDGRRPTAIEEETEEAAHVERSWGGGVPGGPRRTPPPRGAALTGLPLPALVRGPTAGEGDGVSGAGAAGRRPVAGNGHLQRGTGPYARSLRTTARCSAGSWTARCPSPPASGDGGISRCGSVRGPCANRGHGFLLRSERNDPRTTGLMSGTERRAGGESPCRPHRFPGGIGP